MKIDHDQANDLASAAYQEYRFPEWMAIEDASGFSSETSGSIATFSRPVYYRPAEEEAESSDTSTAHFTVMIDLETAAIADAYAIVSRGGDIVGEFDQDARAATYSAAGIAPPKVDIWERLDGDTYYYLLAAATADEYLSGETKTIWLRRELGTWWVSCDGIPGASEERTLELAKIRGGRIVEEGHAASESRIADDLGIDRSRWSLRLEDESIVVENVEDPSLSVLIERGNRFTAFQGDEDLGQFAKLDDAIAALPSSRPAGPAP